MILRIGINQAEAFRAGIDASNSFADIEIDPSKLPVSVKNLLADNMKGNNLIDPRKGDVPINDRRVMAHAPTLEAALEELHIALTEKEKK